MITEAFLQYVWQHRLWQGNLLTVDGRAVEVERQGDMNRDAGPDFLNARVRVGDVDWAGSVEVHIHSSDWHLHGHSADPAYGNVVLHVVMHYDSDVLLSNSSAVPTVELAPYINPEALAAYQRLMAEGAGEVACADMLREVPEFIVSSYWERLAVERLERKTADVDRLLADAHGSWEDVCFWLVARYLGGKTNGFAFEMLAKSVPLRIVAKIGPDLFRIESLLFGQAGMLEGEFCDDYPRSLQREYQYLRKAYSLQPMPAGLWKFFRIRPSGFPTVRIAQLAGLMCANGNIFSKLLDMDKADTLVDFFQSEASAYWTDHYRFDKSSTAQAKRLGRGEALSLVVNAWVPLLFAFGKAHGNADQPLLAIELLRQLPPEQNTVTRTWKALGLTPRNALHSQAQNQLLGQYCTQRRCLECRFGSQAICRGRRNPKTETNITQ